MATLRPAKCEASPPHLKVRKIQFPLGNFQIVGSNNNLSPLFKVPSSIAARQTKLALRPRHKHVFVSILYTVDVVAAEIYVNLCIFMQNNF